MCFYTILAMCLEVNGLVIWVTFMVMVISKGYGAPEIHERGSDQGPCSSPELVGDKAKDRISFNLKARTWGQSQSVTQTCLLNGFGSCAWHRDISVTIAE